GEAGREAGIEAGEQSRALRGEAEGDGGLVEGEDVFVGEVLVKGVQERQVLDLADEIFSAPDRPHVWCLPGEYRLQRSREQHDDLPATGPEEVAPLFP